VIHSDALHWINHYAGEYDMVQVPVLPLPTRFTEWVHGIYIDDFTEYQTRDMPARQAMGAFVPSNGRRHRIFTDCSRPARGRRSQSRL
jgi:adsorption protein B